MQNLVRTLAVSVITATVFNLSLPSFAEEDFPQAQTNPVFERIKQLAGTWQGTMISPETGKPESATVHYEVTSGGTAVLERIFPGTPQEMVTVYYPQGEGIGLTHYCMIGNRPTLTFDRADGNTLVLKMEGLNGISSMEEPHMRSLKLTFDSPNQITQDWECYKDGKPEHNMPVTLTRQ